MDWTWWYTTITPTPHEGLPPPRRDYVGTNSSTTLLLMFTNVPSSTKAPAATASSGVTLSFHRVQNRLCIVCPVMFAGAPFIGEGILNNLSHTGCRVESDRTLLEGSYITLRLLLPDGTRSLSIDLAAVRWVRALYSGIEFLRISADDRARLEQFLISPPR